MLLWNVGQISRLKRKQLDLKCMPNITNIRKRKTQSNLSGSTGSRLVRTTGLEPAWTSAHKNLNLARLPIPPCPHFAVDFDTVQPPRAGVTIDFTQFAESTNARTSPPLHYFAILAYSACNVNLLLHLCVNSVTWNSCTDVSDYMLTYKRTWYLFASKSTLREIRTANLRNIGTTFRNLNKKSRTARTSSRSLTKCAKWRCRLKI